MFSLSPCGCLRWNPSPSTVCQNDFFRRGEQGRGVWQRLPSCLHCGDYWTQNVPHLYQQKLFLTKSQSNFWSIYELCKSKSTPSTIPSSVPSVSSPPSPLRKMASCIEGKAAKVAIAEEGRERGKGEWVWLSPLNKQHSWGYIPWAVYAGRKLAIISSELRLPTLCLTMGKHE